MKYLFWLVIGGLAIYAYLSYVHTPSGHPWNPFGSRPPATNGQESGAAPLASSSSSAPQNLSPAAAVPALPSVQLGRFLEAHLDKMLTPIGADKKVVVDKPRVEIVTMQGSFADGMAKAPATRKPTYQMAITVCQTLAQAVDEREQALASYLSVKPVYLTHQGRTYLDAKVEERWDKRALEIRQTILSLYSREREIEAQTGGPARSR